MPQPGLASFVEVPDPVGVLFMLAIEHGIETFSLDKHDFESGIGNDVEFLRNVQASLERDLGGPLR